MIKKFHHVAIIVSSEESIQFYKKLGFQEYFRKVRPYDTVVLLKGFGMELEMFIDPNHPARPHDPESLGVRHLSFQVDNLDEMVNEFGCDSIKRDWNGIRYANTSDPDGLPIEFHE